MKTKWISLLLVSGMIATAIIINACKKDDDKTEDKKTTEESIESAENNAFMESEFNATMDAADDVASNRTFSKKDDAFNKTETDSTYLPSGAVVVFTDSVMDTNGVAFYIDYGALGTTEPKGKLCKDGRYRAGVLNITLSKPHHQIGSVLSISVPESNNYYVGNGISMWHVSGTKTITRSDTATRTIVVTGGKAQSDAGTITWAANRTVVRTIDGVWGLWGDRFTITGSASGTNLKGVSFNAAIDPNDPLVKLIQIGCANTFINGTVTITNSNGGELILDYDPFNNEACDRTARVTVNGKTKDITI